MPSIWTRASSSTDFAFAKPLPWAHCETAYSGQSRFHIPLCAILRLTLLKKMGIPRPCWESGKTNPALLSLSVCSGAFILANCCAWAQSMRSASRSSVGASNATRKGSEISKVASTSSIIVTADNESPPIVKKWSPRAIGLMLSVRSQMSLSVPSVTVNASWPAAVAGSTGRSVIRARMAWRSTFPLGDIGKASQNTNRDGTMADGSTCSRKLRRFSALMVRSGRATTAATIEREPEAVPNHVAAAWVTPGQAENRPIRPPWARCARRGPSSGRRTARSNGAYR